MSQRKTSKLPAGGRGGEGGNVHEQIVIGLL